MKKAIKRFWGVGLIVIILSSLFVAAAPVSADDNAWVADATTPSMIPFFTLAAPNSDVADIAVSSTGDAVWMVTGTDNFTYKSTNGGMTWATSQTTAMSDMTPTMIAIAPDNADRIAIATAAGMVKVSVNGGVTFATISPVFVSGSGNLTTIKSLTISPVRLGANYVTVSGISDLGKGNVFYYNLGAVVSQGWAAIVPAGDFEDVAAVAYSPNFVSDLTMVALTDNTTTTNTIQLQVYSFSSTSWNSADYTGYPVELTATATTGVLTRARIALDPSYLGGEDTLRNAFVGLTSLTPAVSGIYRVLSTAVRNLYTGSIYSIAYDGTTLVAGRGDSTTVMRSLDPMSTDPAVTGTSTLKSPGGVNSTVVAFVGANVVAGTSGANSAFAISRSSGAAFNDVSMIDTTISDANDIAVSADGTKVYYTTDNSAYTSLWLKTTGWERVLSFADTSDYIIRLSPTNPDVVYMGQVGGNKVYFSKDVQSRWYARTATTGTVLQDMAVESDGICYILNTTGGVVKSSNEGFIWSPMPTATKLTTGYSLVSVQENVLLAGAAAGGAVSYSLDGGTTWVPIPATTETGAGAVIVIPDENYATNSKIYAATTTAGKNIMSYTIGTSAVWTDIYNGPFGLPATEGVYGLAMKGGVIYALSVSTANISYLNQNVGFLWASKATDSYVDPVFGTQQVRLGVDSVSPNTLKASSGTTLWALRADKQTNYSQLVYSITDTLAGSPPTLTGPADMTSVNINPNTGSTDIVVFTWAPDKNASAHTIQLAYDSAFTQQITVTGAAVAFPPSTNIVVGGPSGAANVNLIAGKTYYWRVYASAPLNSPYSEVRSFTVQPMEAAVPAIGSPVNGATIKSQNPAFSWTPVTSATKYEIQVSVGPDFATTVFTDTPASAGSVLPATVKLEQGKQYFWRVRALEPVEGGWSTAANFIVAAAETAAPPPVTITSVPAPTFTIPAAPPAQTVTLTPPAVEQIAPAYIWVIIIIGAILVIAVIVLIVRTRRSV